MSACLIEEHDLGTIPYLEALQQQIIFAQRLAQDTPDKCYLLLAEHPPVITLGKRTDPAAIKDSSGIEVVSVERGGGATVHMLGQLVCYPITRLPAYRVRPYIRMLENTLLRLLDRYGIAAHVDSYNPGVWVGDAKIAAIGIRVRDRITRHGLALNVNNSLELYERIVPCHMPNMVSTSMRELLGRKLDLQEVKHRLVRYFEANFTLM
ncbi:MAG: lipoyl(octanoyl) transferase LipB [Pseudomonadota bacterium]|nr:lipoyl(octanoyl) transferase LipB [Pseudomonadota bacterium]